MMANAGGMSHGAGGGPVRHIPVLLAEVLEALEPAANQTVLDGTFGAGGYSRALLDAGCHVIGLDRDPEAIAGASDMIETYGDRLHLFRARFSALEEYAPPEGLDAVVLDIGVSSMQIDEAQRGFSFQKDGPLDMRMASHGPTAADVVNHLKPGDLARIFGFYGEERHAGRIARAIEKRRQEAPFRTTRDLAGLIETVSPRKAKDKIHPATRVFQALRIFVNEELQELAEALFASERALKTGGRLAVVTFHSLEDRIVKRFFQDRFGRGGASRHLPMAELPAASFEPVGKAMVAASMEESEANPRARSAKLRAGRRTEAPPMAADISLFGLPKLPSLDELQGQSPC